VWVPVVGNNGGRLEDELISRLQARAFGRFSRTGKKFTVVLRIRLNQLYAADSVRVTSGKTFSARSQHRDEQYSRLN